LLLAKITEDSPIEVPPLEILQLIAKLLAPGKAQAEKVLGSMSMTNKVAGAVLAALKNNTTN
jgi:hypothetical protein